MTFHWLPNNILFLLPYISIQHGECGNLDCDAKHGTIIVAGWLLWGFMLEFSNKES